MLSLFLFPQVEAATDTGATLTQDFPYMPQRSTQNSGAAIVKINNVFPTASTATSQNTKSYWTPIWAQSMAHLLTTPMLKFLLLLLEASSLQDPLDSFSPGQSLLRCLCPDKFLPPFPPNSLYFLFSVSCTTISECARHVFLFLLLEHTPLEGGDGDFLRFQCTA